MNKSKRFRAWRANIELAAVVLFVAGFCAGIVWLASYDCFEDNPKIHYSVCAIDAWTSRFERLFR